jgi:hypothetical protein
VNNRGLIPGMGRIFISSPKLSYRFSGLPTLLFSVYGRVKQRGVKETAPSQLLPQFKMNRLVIPLFGYLRGVHRDDFTFTSF